MDGFDLQGGEMNFIVEKAEEGEPKIRDAAETYRDNCSWHGKLDALKK